MTKVDFEKLQSASGAIRSTNERIASSFQVLQGKINQMDAAWNGAASQNAVSAFYRINSTFPKPRKQALESAARVLDAIAVGYSHTEQTNKSLADQFK